MRERDCASTQPLTFESCLARAPRIRPRSRRLNYLLSTQASAKHPSNCLRNLMPGVSSSRILCIVTPSAWQAVALRKPARALANVLASDALSVSTPDGSEKSAATGVPLSSSCALMAFPSDTSTRPILRIEFHICLRTDIASERRCTREHSRCKSHYGAHPIISPPAGRPLCRRRHDNST